MRLFAGVELAGPQKDWIARAVGRLGPLPPGARFVDRRGWHLTIKFLGEIGEDRLEGVCEILAEAAAGAAPGGIPSALAGLGAFPSPRRAHVVWVGMQDPEGGLAALASSAGSGLARAGFEEEARPWHPHVSVARLKQPASVAAALEAAGAGALGTCPLRVFELALFRSHLSPGGASYEVIRRFGLPGRADL